MKDYRLLVVVLVITTLICVKQGFCQEGLLCESYDPTEGIFNGTTTCAKEDHVCFVLWGNVTNAQNETFHIVVKKGCFLLSLDGHPSDGKSCQEDCIQNPNFDILNSFPRKNLSGVCCCNKDMCNRNFTPVYFTRREFTTAPSSINTKLETTRPQSDKTVTVVIACVIFAVLAVVMTVVVIYMYRSKCHTPKYTAPGAEEKELPDLALDLSGLQFEKMVGQGRYGSVWRCYLKGEVVAVKLFPPEHRGTWETERDVYENHLPHPNILQFYFASQRESGYGPEYLLVTEYHSNGSLTHFLRSNTVSWQEMCILSRSLATGLAYLHNDDDNEGKLCFVHRDLSSKNVLVSSDLTCVLSDFGFAMKMPDIGSTKSSEDIITEVGTLRYMAPEVLDGAVNLRECEASLKEIDVYAMSVILWEIAMRCSDIYGREAVPDYKPPFEAELGPSIDNGAMQEFVARQKKRPGFPDVWKHNHPGLRMLKETIEDCWDQDGDARLSALCVKERFSELLKDYPDGLAMAPTVNPVQSILQNYPTSHSQSMTGICSPASSAPPAVIQTNPWSERSSSQGVTMTTV